MKSLRWNQETLPETATPQQQEDAQNINDIEASNEKVDNSIQNQKWVNFIKNLNLNEVKFDFEKNFGNLKMHQIFNKEIQEATDYVKAQVPEHGSDNMLSWTLDFLNGTLPANMRPIIRQYNVMLNKAKKRDEACNNHGHRLHFMPIIDRIQQQTDINSDDFKLMTEQIVLIGKFKVGVYIQNIQDDENQTISDVFFNSNANFNFNNIDQQISHSIPILEPIYCSCDYQYTGLYCDTTVLTNKQQTQQQSNYNNEFDDELGEWLVEQEGLSLKNFNTFGQLTLYEQNVIEEATKQEKEYIQAALITDKGEGEQKEQENDLLKLSSQSQQEKTLQLQNQNNEFIQSLINFF